MAHENRIRDAQRKALEARGAWVLPTTRVTPGRHGVPDLLFCYRGRFGAIETKKPKGSKGTTAEQRREIAMLERAGATVAVCTDVREGLQLLARIDEELTA